MSRIILYFGSFNPIHNGHTAVARAVLESGLGDELWFVVSPENPLKASQILASDADRLRMTQIAVDEELAGLGVVVSDVEMTMPRPSYTIDTLQKLEQLYPDNEYVLLVGGDIPPQIERWKNADLLRRKYRFLVYPREGYSLVIEGETFTYLDDKFMLDFSSTEVRRSVAKKKSVSDMIAPGVARYIEDSKLYSMENLLLELDYRITQSTGEQRVVALLGRGELHYKANRFGEALNDFNEVLDIDPSNLIAREYSKLVTEILEFRHTDLYNP